MAEPEKILITFYTDFDISEVDSIGIIELTGARTDTNHVVNHKIMVREFDENKNLWRFDLHVTDSLRFDVGQLFQLRHDTLYRQYHLSEIELGKHGAYTDDCRDCYYWEIKSYMLDGKRYEDSDVYLTSEKIFRDLHAWQVK